MHETKLSKRLARYAGDHDMGARYRLMMCCSSGGGSDSKEARALSQVQADTGKFMLGLAQERLPGALDSFANAANQFSDPGYADRMAGQANTDAQQAIATNTAAMNRNLSRFGINPNSGRFAGMANDNAIRGAALQTGAMNNARRFVEDKKFGASKDLFATMTGLQSDAANSVGNAANGFMNLSNAAQQQSANEAAGWGQAAGVGLSMIDKFKDGGRVRYANGGLVGASKWQRPAVSSAPNMGASAAGGAMQGLSMGNKLIKAAPKLAEGLSSVSPTVSGHLLQLAGKGIEGVGAEQLGMMAPEIAEFGTASLAEAAGTAAAGTAASTAAAAAAVPVAEAAGVGILESLGILALNKGGHVGVKLKAAERLEMAIKQASKETGVDEGYIRKMIAAESGGNPKAVSPVGAQGLMQLMPATAKQYGVKDPFNVEQNIKGGARLIKDLTKQFDGDMVKVTAAYNWGNNNVSKHGLGPMTPRETRNHVRKVMGDEAADAIPVAQMKMSRTLKAPVKPRPAPMQEGAMSVDAREVSVAPQFTAEQAMQTPARRPMQDALPQGPAPRTSPMLARAIVDQRTLERGASPMLKPTLDAAPQWSRAGYQIRSGDTLSKIAAQHGTTVAAIQAANPQITDVDKIRAGDVLQFAKGGKVNTLDSYLQANAMPATPDGKKAMFEAIFKQPYKGTPDQDNALLKAFQDVDAEDAENQQWDRLPEQEGETRVRMNRGGCAHPMANTGLDATQGGRTPPIGTETSDSIPAVLSKNEYVLSAPAAKMVGYDTLDKINQAGLEMAGRA